MSAYPTHCAIPVRTALRPGHLPEAVTSLNAIFQAGATAFTDGLDQFQFRAHDSEAAAVAYANAHLSAPAAEFSVPLYKTGLNTSEQDSGLWLTVLNDGQPQMRTDAAINGALHEASILAFLEAVKENPNCSILDESIWGGNALRTFLLDAVMFEPVMDAIYALPDEPAEESVSLADRGYVKEVEKINPVEAIINDNEPYEVSNALNERNIDYVSECDANAIRFALNEWTEGQQEDAEPTIEALGFSVGDAKDSLESVLQDTLSNRGGAVTINPTGNFALALIPTIDNEEVYITFDGISSSRFNAVVDESYCAMLDTLKVDVKGWVRHLAESADLGTPNWSIDLKQMLESERPNTIRNAGGVQWSNETVESLKEKLIEAVFFHSDDHSITDAKWATADYLFDIALEVFKDQASDMDMQWMQSHGIDLDALAAITSTKAQHEAFPQLRESPGYFFALANMGSNNSVSYEWENPPSKTTEGPIITVRDLTSVLDNASYSGTVAIAVEASYDDLQKINKAMHAGAGDKLTLKGAYFHIQDYINGAGDGEQLSDPLTIDAADIGSKWKIINDAAHRCGITETFGQFLASSSTVTISAPARQARAEAEKQRQDEPNTPSLG